MYVKLTPKSNVDYLDSIEEASDGKKYIKAKIREIPEKGRANKALCFLISKFLEIPKSNVMIISGSKSKYKKVMVDCKKDEQNMILEKLNQKFS